VSSSGCLHGVLLCYESVQNFESRIGLTENKLSQCKTGQTDIDITHFQYDVCGRPCRSEIGLYFLICVVLTDQSVIPIADVIGRSNEIFIDD